MSQGGQQPGQTLIQNHWAGDTDKSETAVADISEFLYPSPSPGFPVNGMIAPGSISGTFSGAPQRLYYYVRMRGPDVTVNFDSQFRVLMIDVMRLWWKMPQSTAVDNFHNPHIPAIPLQQPEGETLFLCVQEIGGKGDTPTGGINAEKTAFIHYPGGPQATPVDEDGATATAMYPYVVLPFPMQYQNPSTYGLAPLGGNTAQKNLVIIRNETRFQRYFNPSLGSKSWRFSLRDIANRVYTGGNPLAPSPYDPMYYGGAPIVPTPPATDNQFYPVLIHVEMAIYGWK